MHSHVSHIQNVLIEDMEKNSKRKAGKQTPAQLSEFPQERNETLRGKSKGYSWISKGLFP